MYGERAVLEDSRLRQHGKIFKKDGILYNCAFSLCDKGDEASTSEIAIIQLIAVPEKNLHLFTRRGIESGK
ncbi:Poly [ADP-ribose] polymerase 3 [Dionaea muscipula]